MKLKKIILSIALLGYLLVSFKAETDNPLFKTPSNFPTPTYHFDTNPLSSDGVLLGKKLFYDPILSKDNSISCGSCHQQIAGFTQQGHALSHGVNDKFTKRNAMPLLNLAWSTSFGWDGGVHDLDLFALSPIQNPVEMDERLPNIINKLKSDKDYIQLFERAFGSKEINTERFLKALSQFMLTMVSANSKYDKFIRNEGEVLSESELKGLNIFKNKCTNCHKNDLFTDNTFRNNGLEIINNEDLGRAEVTHKNKDKYKFKVPSLRNISHTAPYMHDGRFESLTEVLEHYSSGISKNTYTDPSLLNLTLNKEEKQNLIDFLNTLTDRQFLQDTRFAENQEQDIGSVFFVGDWTKIDFGQIPKSVNDSINSSIQYYLKMKNALVDENQVDFVLNTKKALSILKNINKTELTKQQRAFFEQVYSDLFFDLRDISTNQQETLQHQREHFGTISTNFYKLIKAFKSNKRSLIYLLCPMANNQRGAFWLSESYASNPYFGKDNAKCANVTFELILGIQATK